jgi:hypothetical protein
MLKIPTLLFLVFILSVYLFDKLIIILKRHWITINSNKTMENR